MRRRIRTLTVISCLALLLTAVLLWLHWQPMRKPAAAESAAVGAGAEAGQGEAIAKGFRDVLAAYRQIIVLLADEKSLADKDRAAVNAVGQNLFHENLARVADLQARLGRLLAEPKGLGEVERLLDYVESDPDLYDADRLAFRELLVMAQTEVGRNGALPAVKLHKRIGEDLDALAEIEKTYEREISQIFSRFDSRAIVLKRERWDDYLAKLKARYSREQIMKDYGVVLPYPAEKLAALDKSEREAEIFGRGLPAKTIVLTFDDGPHQRYTEEIEAILQQYGVPAVFFQVGRNLGEVSDGAARLGANYKVARKLMGDGFVLGNHSYSHAQLSREHGEALKAEIGNTDALLRAVNPARAPLFRFPYGAHNPDAMQMLDAAALKSVMWNIDSLDWADPVPSSIADRVLRSIDKEGSGIVLFHDIHERTVKALPLVLDRLVADGYQFAGWDGQRFSLSQGKAAEVAKATVTTGYNQSWAVIIGVDEYAKWPRLQYAVNDARAVRESLLQKFGFRQDHVVMLTNAEATRNGILAAFHDRLAHAGMQKNDRVFVFFAGHGATRKLSSGRDLGYIVPVDADPEKIATDGIAMSEIQNIAESLSAKHVLFVMDSCYSGLGLTRGSGNAFLRDNAKRVGRQMLTAGGADQMVADGGPSGHSIFTWTLLQALAGKGDLNGDGYITATELAAFLAPAVANVSQQTPAFGSLPGSQGGEFVFDLPAEGEYLNADTSQLSGEAIALNTRLDAAVPAAAPASSAPAAAASATLVPDLQGKERKLVPQPAVGLSIRQQAQRANDRGLQLYREKRYAEAESAFTEALKLRPDFALAANNLGYVFYKQEKYREAARWFENTLKLDPSRAVAYLNLGDALALAGDKEPASKAFKTYLELAPNGAGVSHAREMLAK